MMRRDLSASACDAALLHVDQTFVVRRRDSAGLLILWSPDRGREVRITSSLWALVTRFVLPTSPAAVVSSVAGHDEALGRTVKTAIGRLLTEGVLTEYKRPSPTGRDAGSIGMFGARLMTAAQVVTDSSVSVAVVGVEYDAGASGRTGSRTAPDAIRRVSTSLFTSRDGRGMYDPVSGEILLENIVLADLGNIGSGVQRRNGETLDQLTELVSVLSSSGQLPVIIGGDHSITHAVIRGLIRDGTARIGLLHFDAHSDYLRVAKGDWRSSLHHGNVMSWVAGEEAVVAIAQFGVRHLVDRGPSNDSKIIAWPGRSALEASPKEIADSLPSDIDWHVTIDVDVLDPAALPSTGTPVPGGFTLAELNRLLQGLLRHVRVVGIDMVELIGDADNHSALTAADVLLRCLDAATSPYRLTRQQGRRRGPPSQTPRRDPHLV